MREEWTTAVDQRVYCGPRTLAVHQNLFFFRPQTYVSPGVLHHPFSPAVSLGNATQLAFTIGKRVKVMATVSGPGTEDLGYFSLTSSKSFFPSSLEKRTEDDLASAMQVTLVT